MNSGIINRAKLLEIQILTLAFKAAIAAALESASRVDARGVVAAVVAAVGTFVDVVAIVSAKTFFTAALEATG